MVLLELVDHGGQRGGRLRDVGGFLRRQLVEVLVDRRQRLHLLLDAVDAGHQHGREREVRVAGAVRAAELEALGLRVVARDRDTDARRPVALAVHQIDRGLVARHQPLVGVHRRVGERQQRRGVVQDAADVVAGHVRQTGVTRLVVEQRLAVLPQRLVCVHAGAVVAEQRLGHEGDGLAVGPGGVLDDVFEQQHVVGRVQQRVELVVDLGLTGGADLVVAALEHESRVLQVGGHLVAQVDVVVVGRHREVTALGADLVATVGRTVGLQRLEELINNINEDGKQSEFMNTKSAPVMFSTAASPCFIITVTSSPGCSQQ